MHARVSRLRTEMLPRERGERDRTIAEVRLRPHIFHRGEDRRDNSGDGERRSGHRAEYESAGNARRRSRDAGDTSEDDFGPAASLHECDEVVAFPDELARRDLSLLLAGVSVVEDGRLEELPID